MRLLLIGPPGSGKGTQGARIAAHFGIAHIASGDLLREEVAAKTPIGAQAAGLMSAGELVPDELILSMVMPRVLAAGGAGGYVLDGFPRSLGQAIEARRIADQHESALEHVVRLQVPAEDLIARLLNRAQLEGRPDDTREVIERRLAVFDDATAPLLDYYGDRGLLIDIDATRSPDEVFEQIVARLPQRDAA